jgi:hypothetical protein
MALAGYLPVGQDVPHVGVEIVEDISRMGNDQTRFAAVYPALIFLQQTADYLPNKLQAFQVDA